MDVTSMRSAVTRADFSTLTGVPVGTLKRWAHEGVGPATKKAGIGWPRHCVRYERDEIVSFLLSGDIAHAFTKRDRHKLLSLRISLMRAEVERVQGKIRKINDLISNRKKQC